MTRGAAAIPTAHAGTTGAERLLQAAVVAGLGVCFANPGTSEMHFVSALDSVGGLRPVLGLHETVCTGAADGYGRMAHKPALVLLHLGPGLANGLANLHNARRGGTPVVNLVGDMATWHKGADALLDSDITALAGAVSGHVRVCHPGDDLAAAMAAAVAAATGVPRPAAGDADMSPVTHNSCAGDSRVSTLVIPHDLSWARAAGGGLACLPGDCDQSTGICGSRSAARTEQQLCASVAAPCTPAAPAVLTPGAQQFVREAAAALRACPRGRAALYLGGRAALAEGDALLSCGRIAAATGAALLCENAFARLDRGVGLPDVQRLPYFPQEAAAALAPFQLLLLLDARRPVANFGYEGAPSQLVQLPDDAVWEFDAWGVDLPAALRMLAEEVGGGAITPGINCGGVFCAATRHPLPPPGRLTSAALCQTVAALQPEGAIIVDESLTSGGTYFAHSRSCPPFTHLTLTGGAIGAGIPLSVGAAIACSNRPVINLQADGSGMYSLQGLWTQAREGLHVVTIICANRSYAILKLEMARQRITPSNGAAARTLTEIGAPPIDWVLLAQGMGVTALRATTCEELAAALGPALQRRGPTLIEAVL